MLDFAQKNLLSILNDIITMSDEKRIWIQNRDIQADFIDFMEFRLFFWSLKTNPLKLLRCEIDHLGLYFWIMERAENMAKKNKVCSDGE